MARSTPTPNRWPSNNVDMNTDVEAQPLLDLEEQPKVSKKTHHENLVIDHGYMAWLQVFCGWILFMNSCGI
ncbi:hypothetical protein CC80DRAFT_550734 [Byssothecium circinans]|uniref:Uncharacterized protein n=1 Tax=Byssothecium circinans TaxID=147558 RepID=A0A6A5TPW6_9PLEO|nr:hypothetical protein CC80DRAFT_550734 [Byssothecium circinans]